MKSRRVVIMSDLHCGHRVGLTPTGWQLQPEKDAGKRNKWVKIQRALWDEYTKLCRLLQPVDVLIVNGDCIDGEGEKSGGIAESYDVKSADEFTWPQERELASMIKWTRK